MVFKQRNLFLFIVLICLSSKYLKLTQANSIFRFGFDFGLNLNENSFKTSFKIGDDDKETTTTKDSSYFTESPATVVSPILTEIWSKQTQLNATAYDKLQATRLAVTQLKNEILVVVGRSDFLAAKVKLMTRYLNKVNTVLATNTDEGANCFLILQDYVQLVDDLRAPPTSAEGGERSLDYMVMKLGLEKHKLIELQTQILLEVLQAVETWETYVKKQLVDVGTV